MKLAAIAAVFLVIALRAVAAAPDQPVSITLAAATGNAAAPQMGDNLSFHSVIRNDGAVPVTGLIALLSLVEVDRGNEQPVDLEDWSAHKAVTIHELKPGETIATDWPMRLISAGRYRVVVSAASRDGAALSTSPFADFSVREKPVVESRRVLPVALGIPLLIGVLMTWRSRFALLPARARAD